MNHTLHCSTITDHTSGTPDMGGLIALLERGCKRLMKEGGGGLPQAMPHAGGFKPAVKRKILGYARRGWSLQAIAARVHCHYGSVVKVTRPLRHAAKEVKP